MNLRSILPAEIVDESVVFPLLSAYDVVARELERATGMSQTRIMILILFRNGAQHNQNQVATALGADRTVVHRVIKTMIADKLIRAESVKGRRAIKLTLSEQGEDARAEVVKVRRQIDLRLKRALGEREARSIAKVLGQVEAALRT